MTLVTDLTYLHSNLVAIKEYISKLGPERRRSPLGIRKYDEACAEYKKLDCILSHVKRCIAKSEVSSCDLTLINDLVTQIHCIFNKINSLSCLSSSSVESTSSVEDRLDKEKYSKMATEKFDIKTAISLLPILTGQEHISKSLIDGIELYSSLLSVDTHPQLINFVLKTRLSSSAKLRMKSNYDSVANLVSDLKKYILPKRSPVALQSQLQSCNQGSRSIEAFGTELEDLFVNLTIAQADNDNTKYDILRPLNEKVAIKRFADGLSNSRLSTIIASRQFDSLSEAIRTAKDEQSLSTDNNVMSFSRTFSRSNFSRGNFRNRNYYDNRDSYSKPSSSWVNRQGNAIPLQPQSYSHRGHVHGNRGSGRRASAYPRQRGSHHVRHVTHDETVNPQNDSYDDELSNEFFRS